MNIRAAYDRWSIFQTILKLVKEVNSCLEICRNGGIRKTSAKASAYAERLCQRAAVEWHDEDTEKAPGKRSQTDAIAIEVKNGRISYWQTISR